MKKLFKKLFPSKEMRAYRKMYRKHRKTMIKLAKEDRDWDYCFLHNLVVHKIKHMYEYYSAGNNVWQTEESSDIILKTLKHAIDLADEIDNLWNGDVKDYWKKEEELYKEFYSYIGQNIMWWWD